MSRIAVWAIRSSYPLDCGRILVGGDQLEHGLLDRAVQRLHVARLADLRQRAADRQAGVEAVEYARVDVGGAADRGRVAEIAGDLLDGSRLGAVPRGLRSGRGLARHRE